jgi:hypothetical protein
MIQKGCKERRAERCNRKQASDSSDCVVDARSDTGMSFAGGSNTTPAMGMTNALWANGALP